MARADAVHFKSKEIPSFERVVLPPGDCTMRRASVLSPGAISSTALVDAI